MDRRNLVRPFLKMAGVMTQARREDLKSSQFAVPVRKARKLGVEGEIQGAAKGKYPIPDLSHARNALARVSQFGSLGERVAVRKKVYSKYPQLREGFEERHGESPTSKENLKKTKVASFIEKLAATVEMRALTPAQKAYMDRLTGNTQGQSISRNPSNRRLDYHLNAAPGAPGLNTELHAPGAGLATAEDMAAKAKARHHFDQVLQQQGKATNMGTGGATLPGGPVAPTPQADTVASTPRAMARQGATGTVASTPKAMSRQQVGTATTHAATPVPAQVSVPGKVTSPAAFAKTHVGPAPSVGRALPKPGKLIPLKPKPGLLNRVGKLLRRAA